MKIAINGKHGEKLADALNDAQKRCTARCLTVEKIDSILESVNDRMTGISKKSMAGTRIIYTGAEKLPNAYKHTPESTHFTAEHNGRYWTIVALWRGVCPNRINNLEVELSDSAKLAILNSYGMMEV